MADRSPKSGAPERHEVASLVRIAPHLRAILASHVALQLMNRHRLRPPHDVEGNGLIGVATETSDFQIAVTGIERVTERRRWLRRSLKAEHALVPRLDGASRSAFLRASVARSAAARTDPP
jgi:hypothetical protein